MNILFDDLNNRSKVSDYSLGVIRDLMTAAGLTDVVITSVQRTAAEQAHAMYANCVQKGAQSQLALYGNAGDEVVRVFIAWNGRPAGQIVAAMAAKIVELGPGNVSHHCADQSKLNVIDISATRVPMRQRMESFHDALKRESRISRFFDPFTADHRDPAFHIEIPQP